MARHTAKSHKIRKVEILVIQIPIVPINFESNGEIKCVSDYMLDIQKCSDDEIERLDYIIETLNDSQGNIEQLLDKVLEDWGFVDLEEENE